MKKTQTTRGNIVVGILVWGLIIWGISSFFSADSNDSYSNSYNTDYYNIQVEDYEDEGYSWAEENDISSFEDCQNQFGTGYEEDECNQYVKENYSGFDTYNGYECTEDCSGHEAGYEWAEENYIYDIDDCGGNSDSFTEGCWSYVEENY